LKVELSPEVGEAVKNANPDGEVSKQDNIMSNLKGTVADKMLADNRGGSLQEESKEKPDVNQPRYPKINKGYMEDIKEQDSEAENQYANVSKPTGTTPGPGAENLSNVVNELTQKRNNLDA
jgi:hypothetical protein